MNGFVMVDSPHTAAHHHTTETEGEGKYCHAKETWKGIEEFKWADEAWDSPNYQ